MCLDTPPTLGRPPKTAIDTSLMRTRRPIQEELRTRLIQGTTRLGLGEHGETGADIGSSSLIDRPVLCCPPQVLWREPVMMGLSPAGHHVERGMAVESTEPGPSRLASTCVGPVCCPQPI